MIDARIIVVVIIGFLIGGVVLASGSLNPADFTDGEEGGKYLWRGKVTLTDTDYVTSWLPSTQSEDITAVSEAKLLSGTSGYEWTHYRLIAYLEGVEIKRKPATDWIEIPDIYLPDNVWVPLDSWTFNVDGPVIGKLKVELEAKLAPRWWNVPGQKWEGTFAWDGARLRSGFGELFLYGDKGPFEEGETARMYVKTGFTNGAGWVVKLRPPLTRPELFAPKTIATIGDDLTRIVDIKIEPGWFTVGDRVDNEFIVELWNQFFNDKWEHFFAVDDRARAPIKPVLSSELDGSSATITALSEATFKNIKEFVVWAWYGTQSKPSISAGADWILQASEYPASGSGDNYTATFTIQAKNFDGAVFVEVISVDQDGRTSPPTTISFKVRDGSFEPGDPIKQPFIWSPLVYLLIVLGLIFGSIATYYVWITTGGLYMTIFAFIIIFGVFGVAAYVAGATPVIAGLLGLMIGGI